MKKLLLTTCLIFAVGAAVLAQNQSKKQRIQYLFTLMRQDSMMSKMAVTMSSYFSKTMAHGRIEKDDVTAVNDSLKMAKIMVKTIKTVSELMKDDMVASYDKHFTSAEIEDYITFYQSKSGQKMLEETPDITKEIMMDMATKYQPTMQEEIKKQMEEK